MDHIEGSYSNVVGLPDSRVYWVLCGIGFFDRPGLYMVPLKVHFGDQMFRDGVDMTYKEFFAKLEASDILPTTSQPTAGEFTATYEEAKKTYKYSVTAADMAGNTQSSAGVNKLVVKWPSSGRASARGWRA